MGAAWVKNSQDYELELSAWKEAFVYLNGIGGLLILIHRFVHTPVSFLPRLICLNDYWRRSILFTPPPFSHCLLPHSTRSILINGKRRHLVRWLTEIACVGTVMSSVCMLYGT